MVLAFKKSLFLPLGIIAAALLFSFALVAGAAKSDIVYPVGELGNCKNEQECRAFCDAADNLERVKACIAFAKKYNLLSPQELEDADYYVIARGITSGPGKCKNQQECDSYCEDTAHLNECLDFAEKHQLRPVEEIAEGRKVASALQQGANLPGGCRTKAQCEQYCEDPKHMRECVAFAEKAGFISAQEAEEAKKIIPLMEQGAKTPGNCARKEACEQYCYEPSHIDECLAFAEKAGLIGPDELADAKKVASFIKSGETPGGCRRRAECEIYCSDTGHFEECVAFGEKAGLMSKEDAELARKVKGVGPGGCKSRDECETFCRNPSHEEECLNFAKEQHLEEFSNIEAEIKTKVEGEVKICLEKPTCKEIIGCFQEISSRTGKGKGELSGEASAKLDACVAQITKELKGSQKPHDQNRNSEGATPEMRPTPPTDIGVPQEYQKQYEQEYQKEYEKQYQQEYQKQYQEEYQRQLKLQQPQQ